MAEQTQISAAFLADLDIVCPNADDGALPFNFIKDLEGAYVHALAYSPPTIALADLAFLEEELTAWRNIYQGRLQHYLAQLPSDDPLLGHVSLFGTMDFGRLETAQTRALAWLLDNQEHGFGNKLLEALLNYLTGRQIELLQVDKVESEYWIHLGPTKAGRIDVFAKGSWDESGKRVSWVLAIEAKIDADEGEDQLSQYDGWLERASEKPKVIRVFLTPDGREPGSNLTRWQNVSFVDLAGVFRRVPGLEKKPGYHFLRYYLTGVLRDICELPVPISSNPKNPYTAVDYLKSVLGNVE